MKLPERSRYVRGMIHWVGFRQIGVPYTRKGRLHGGENRRWFGDGVISLVSMTLDAVFSFSLKPLRLFSLLGFLTLLVAVALAAVYVSIWLTAEQIPRGFTTQTIISLFHLGVTSLGVGILGEYIGRIYMEVKQRPGWIINYTMNCEETGSPPAGDQHQYATPNMRDRI
jgi:dolichol-phosphate mannosyltransferase